MQLPQTTTLVLTVLVTAVASGLSGAQLTPAADDPFDPAGLGQGPYEEMSALMEVTIFNIDVLTLTVRVSAETGDRLRRLTEGRGYGDQLADSVAAVILTDDDLWARQVLERNVGYGRMLGGMRETMEKAADAGYVTTQYVVGFAERLPELFGFLEADGAKEGDAIFFRIRGDTVRTLYRTVAGDVLLDRSVVDGEARRGSIPSFFAPRTRFRKRLVESLLDPSSR
jgi:hypothetical protein